MNANKKFFFLLTGVILFFSAVNVQAQVKIGVTTAYNIDLTNTDNMSNKLSIRTYDDELGVRKVNTGPSVGLNMFTSFDKLFLRVESNYQQTSTTYIAASYIGNEGGFIRQVTEATDKRHLISIPVTAGVQLNKVQLGLGPIFNFNIGNENQLDLNSNITYQDRDFTTGFQFFTAYKILENIHIHARYQTAFSTIGDQLRYDNKPVSLDYKVTQLSIGLSLFY